jgi:hypothetical protein
MDVSCVPQSSYHFRNLRKPGALTANEKTYLNEIMIALHGFDVVKCRPLILDIPDSESDYNERFL